MSRCVPALFLLLFPLPLFAAGHEISTVRYAPSDSYSGSPSLASNGNRFLMLWPMDGHIYGALSDPASDTQPPAFPAVPFASASPLQVTPAGSGYLAIWNRYGVPPSLGTLNSEGVLEHVTQLDVSTLSSPRMAFNGSHVLIVDQPPTSTSTPNPTNVSLYDLGGALVRRFPLPVFGAYAVTAAGNDFAVVTAGQSGINEWRVANDGTILSTLQIEPPPANDRQSAYHVDVAPKNGRIAIAWAQLRTGTLAGALIQPNGTITKMALVDGGLPQVSGLAVLPVDIGFVVTWNVDPSSADSPTLFALRLDQDGSLLDARPVSLGNAFFGAVASSGRAIELAFLKPTPAPPSTLIVTVDANGFSPRATTTAVTAVHQSLPVVTGNGSGFTTAWLEHSEGFRGIVAGRTDQESKPLDGSGITVGLNAYSAPVIAHGPSQSLVAWSTSDSVVAARLSPSGEVLDPTPIPIAKMLANSIAAAWNGNRYFVVWPDGTSLVGAFVGPDGVATTPRWLGNQTTDGTFGTGLDMAWDGKQFVLVFGESVRSQVVLSYSGGVCVDCTTPDHVRVMRVSATGDAIDVIPVRIPGVHLRAHVASSGTESLIALDSASDTSTMIVGEQFGYLSLGPEFPLFHWFLNIGSDVTWNGSTYVVGWRYTAPSPADSGWFGAGTVSRSGVPLQSFVTPGAGPPDAFASLVVPSVATNDSGEIGFVISEIASPSYVARARLYLMSEMASMPAPPPAPRNVISDFGGGTTLIQWQSDGANGFFLESSFDFGKSWYPFAVTGDVRSTTVPSTKPGDLIRVSAFGPGGLSAGTITSIGSPQKRRAERR